MNTDGTNQRRVSPSTGGYNPDAGLDWSADGQWIVVRGQSTLELLNVTSGESLPLPFATRLFQPAFLR
jgi:Tol biopolymer transport system component